MRLATIAKNIKASGVCGVHYVGPLREVWIMTAHGIYRLNGYPKPIDRDETAMMFGIGPKTQVAAMVKKFEHGQHRGWPGGKENQYGTKKESHTRRMWKP